MMVELMFPEETILQEIGNKEFTQKDVAKTYGLIIRQRLPVNWQKINFAIMERWSRYGLERIKEMAWHYQGYAKKKKGG